MLAKLIKYVKSLYFCCLWKEICIYLLHPNLMSKCTSLYVFVFSTNVDRWINNNSSIAYSITFVNLLTKPKYTKHTSKSWYSYFIKASFTRPTHSENILYARVSRCCPFTHRVIYIRDINYSGCLRECIVLVSPVNHLHLFASCRKSSAIGNPSFLKPGGLSLRIWFRYTYFVCYGDDIEFRSLSRNIGSVYSVNK